MGNVTEIKKFNYGEYSSENYGYHTMGFTDADGNDFYFSYNTLVAFRKAGHSRCVVQNQWGSTTGKHLNWIDGGYKKERLTVEEYKAKFKEQFGMELKTPRL